MAEIVKLGDFEGVNLDASPAAIEDNELAWSQNMYVRDAGELQSRPTTVGIANLKASSVTAPEGALLFPFTDANGKYHLIAWLERPTDNPTGSALYDYDFDATAGTLLQSVASLSRPQILVWNRKLYVFTGTDQNGYVIAPDGTGALVSTAIAWGEAIKPKVAGIYQNSFVLANMGGSDESTLRFCEVNDPSILLSAAKGIYLNRGDGDRIVGVAEISVQGGANYIEPYMVVWKRRSTWLVSGAPPTSTTDGTLRIISLNKEEGLAAKETLASTEHGLIWSSGRNVYFMPWGGTPIAIGNKIRKYLSKLPQESTVAWHAVYHDGFYRLTVPRQEGYPGAMYAPGAAPPGSPPLGYTGGQSVATEQWWCDVRDPSKPKWWGPMTIPCTASVMDRQIDGSYRLLLAYGTQYAGVSSFGHRLVELSDLPYMGPTGNSGARVDDHCEMVLYTIAEGQEVRGKELTFGDPNLNKLILQAEVNIWADASMVLGMDLLGDGGNAIQIASGHLTLEDPSSGFVLDVSALDTGVLTMKYTNLIGYPPDAGRFLAKTWQPVVKYRPPISDDDDWFNCREVRIRMIAVRVSLKNRRSP